jgi:hypothetical protein
MQRFSQNAVAQLVNKLRVFMKLECWSRFCDSSPLSCIRSQLNPVCTFTPYLSKSNFDIINRCKPVPQVVSCLLAFSVSNIIAVPGDKNSCCSFLKFFTFHTILSLSLPYTVNMLTDNAHKNPNI